jgi:hypothetical protein
MADLPLLLDGTGALFYLVKMIWKLDRNSETHSAGPEWLYIT